jgi:glutamyl-tRNA reductase
MKPITQEKDRLGFVGIGYMGRPIARRLLESGFKLTAYDRHHTKAEELIPYGGTVAQSVSELSCSCNVVLSCLPSDEAVLGIYKGPDGVFANVQRGSLVIDLSTVYPETSQELSRLGSERGVEVLDVTMSGSTLWGRREEVLRWRRVDLSRYRQEVFLSRAERLRSDDEACGEHLTGNRNAGDCRSRRTRREGWS